MLLVLQVMGNIPVCCLYYMGNIPVYACITGDGVTACITSWVIYLCAACITGDG